MSDTHNWGILINCIADAQFTANCVWYPGPFDPNTSNVLVAHVEATNVGNMTDLGIMSLFDLTQGPPGELLETANLTGFAPGDIWVHEFFATSPGCDELTGGGTWALGVKVYCDSEGEPMQWGLGAGKTAVMRPRLELPSWVIPTVAIGGFLGIAYLATR